MIDQTIEKLVEFLESASPTVWIILCKQVYVDAVSFVVWAIGLIVGTFLLIKFGKVCQREMEADPYSMWEMGIGFSYIFGVSFAVVSFSLLVSAVTRFMNPEFYAIQYILKQIGGQ